MLFRLLKKKPEIKRQVNREDYTAVCQAILKSGHRCHQEKKEEKEKKAKGKKRERRDGYRRWWENQATIPLRTSKRRKEIKRALAPVNCLLVEAGPSPLPVMRVSKHFI